MLICGGRATEFEWGPTRLPIETKLRIPQSEVGQLDGEG